ncbi:Hypothetical predicted protein, partial [Pelobates cultripes]
NPESAREGREALGTHLALKGLTLDTQPGNAESMAAPGPHTGTPEPPPSGLMAACYWMPTLTGHGRAGALRIRSAGPGSLSAFNNQHDSPRDRWLKPTHP